MITVEGNVPITVISPDGEATVVVMEMTCSKSVFTHNRLGITVGRKLETAKWFDATEMDRVYHQGNGEAYLSITNPYWAPGIGV